LTIPTPRLCGDKFTPAKAGAVTSLRLTTGGLAKEGAGVIFEENVRGVCPECQFHAQIRIATPSEVSGPAVCVPPVGGLRIVPNTYSSALSVKKTR